MITNESILVQIQSCFVTANYEMSTEMDGTHMEAHTKVYNKYSGPKSSRQEGTSKIDDNTESHC